MIMNCVVFQLRELAVEVYQVREVLRPILHTIMFHRALGCVTPRDTASQLFEEVMYVKCGDAAFDRSVERSVDELLLCIDKSSPRKEAFTLTLGFYSSSSKKSSSAASSRSKAERVYWEQWHVNLRIKHGQQQQQREQQQQAARLESELRELLQEVLKLVGESTDHIPPVKDDELIIPFPYDIVVPSTSDSSFSVGLEMIKRILHTVPAAYVAASLVA